MTQPSLIEQLKGILSEYPDGGQILKELLQNAEDAGASTVKILYDARNVNQGQSQSYSKFFKGPALLVYNDANFTDQDWEGITQIYSSVKRNDMLKVGRFGLGFRSVHHMTDFPSVLSGNTLLLMDPNEQANRVNAAFAVNALDNSKGLIKKSEVISAYGGQFQISTGDLTSGSFKGTLFRFPLRQGKSNLSETIYTEEKVLNLFEAFKKEAAYILLFMKNIASITIHIRKEVVENIQHVATVELVDNVEQVQGERNRIKKKISSFDPDNIREPMASLSQLMIQTSFTQNRQIHKSKVTWLEVDYVIGNNASNCFRKLIQDKSIDFCPCVGVAVPLFQDTPRRLDGHTFCCLPLPTESQSHTGFPCHINGSFALNQSRHHIKWPTNEQRHSHITDNSILWNQCLLKEAMPLAYRVLVQNAIGMAKRRQLDQEDVTDILPLYDVTAENWRPFLKDIFESIEDVSFLKVHGSNAWVTVHQACYATLQQCDQSKKDQLVFTLLEMKQPYVNISVDMFETLGHFFHGLTDLDPRMMATLLNGERHGTYTLLSPESKLCILEFLLSTSEYHLVNGLELIPTASGAWDTFMQPSKDIGHPLFASSSCKQLTFPGFEHIFIQIPDSLLPHFNNMCNREMYNVRHLTDDVTVHLLEKILSSRCGRATNIPITWLEHVWRHFRLRVDRISNLTLVPVLRQGSWDNPVGIDLVKLNQMPILKDFIGHKPLPEGLCQCLEQLSLTVLPSLPDWFPIWESSAYISQPSPESVITLLVKLVNTSNTQVLADRFNRKCDLNHRTVFGDFITNCQISDRKYLAFIKKLEVFPEKESCTQENRLVSLDSSRHNMQYIRHIVYPIKYPKPYVVADEKNEYLIRKLGASKCQRIDLVELTLQQIVSGHYSRTERSKFMNFFIENLPEFEVRHRVMNCAKQVKFVECGHTLKMPMELFEPYDDVLRRLFSDNMFPDDKTSKYLQILKKLGLKSVSDIDAEDIKNVSVAVDKVSKQRIQHGTKAYGIMELLKRNPDILLHQCRSGQTLAIELRELQWVQFVNQPAAPFPPCIPWYTHSYSLCKPNMVREYRTWHTHSGSTLPTVHCDSDKMCRNFGWYEDPPVDKVVEQLSLISKHYDVKYNSEIVMMIKNIYRFLNNHRQEVKPASFRELVWCGRKFVSPSSLIVDITPGNIDLQPYFFFIPDEFSVEFRELFIELGCRKCQDIDVLISCLHTIKDKYRNQHGNIDEDMRLVVRILEKIGKESPKIISNKTSEILIPVNTTRQRVIMFKPPTECTYMDSKYMNDENDGDFVINYSIRKTLAVKLGVKSKQRKIRGNISRGIPFGQREDLVTRLKGLLKAYPCDSGIMKELIQNADDAGATEICFITDFATHKEDRMYGCKMLNQPSLCVYNNSCFSEQDLNGIHDIGRGSKGDDPSKTGQYGVGFNAVYHLTDIPSFMSAGSDIPNGGAMCIFDPLCDHIDGVKSDEPGIRSDIDGLKSKFPGVLLGFHVDKLLANGVGTVFRFPLRQKKSHISNEVISPERMQKILDELKTEMFEALLFVKNVSCIKIMDISSGNVHEKYVVRLRMSTKDREQLQTFHSVVERHKDDKLENLNTAPIEVQYEVKVEDSNTCSKGWLIVQRFGANVPDLKEGYEHLCHAFNDGLINLLPIGGIAIPTDRFEDISKLQSTEAAFTQSRKDPLARKVSQYVYDASCRAFCFLPLPVKTDLPVHINGHFALDEARRDLWKEGYRERWNDYILNHVVIPAWISGITKMQTLYVERYIGEFRSWKHVTDLLSLYHSFFPRQQSGHSFCARTVHFFYAQICKYDNALFPVVDKQTTFSIAWYPLNSADDRSNSVFNTVYITLRKEIKFEDIHKRWCTLTSFFKNLGMKLLDTPLDIQTTIAALKFPTRVSDPNYTIEFLRTHDQKSGCCNTGGIEKHVEDTNYKCCENLKHVVYYLHLDPDFRQKVEGLPVMLTADSVVRLCSFDKPIISSPFRHLLPGSSNRFLHECLSGLFPLPIHQGTMEVEKVVVVNLTVDTFAKLLPSTYDTSVYRTGNPVICEASSVYFSWINDLFHFLYEQNSGKLPSTLQKIEEWSFLPSIEEGYMQTHRSLIPISMFHTLYRHYAWREMEVNRILGHLRLPSLDVAFLNVKKPDNKEQKQHAELKVALFKCCASTDTPERLLKCLIYHKIKLRGSVIKANEAMPLLSYFSRNWNVLDEKYGPSLQYDLRQLPLFITIQQTVISLDDNRVLVLPPDIPTDGIEEWARNEGILLLQNSELVEPLYQYMQLSLEDTFTFYRDNLLPFLTRSMPRVHWKTHVIYVRKHYFDGHETVPEIKNLLVNVPFIQSKRANEFYYHEEPVFECMLPSNRFLPMEYRTSDWIRFLRTLDLIMVVDDDQFVSFARLLESERGGDIINKSFFLVNNLIDRKKSDTLLERIRNIRFIVPFKIEDSMKTYCPQYENAARLICFEDSVSEKENRLCWTSMPLIPESILSKLDTDHKSTLGVVSDVPIDKVMDHCSELCVSFKQQLNDESNCTRLADFVKDQMFIFYEYFSRYSMDDRLHHGLNHIPVVYIPQEKDLVLPENTVIDLNVEDQVVPYLYKVPAIFGKYNALFTSLGCLERLNCQTLALILEEIHSNHQDNVLIGSDFGVVSKTLLLFFRILPMEITAEHVSQSLFAIDRLYLPNTDKVLCNSKNIYINNSPDFSNRLNDTMQLNWFIDLKALEIAIPDETALFGYFPEKIKPKLLTDEVTEDISFENMKEIECRLEADYLESFLKSQELLEGLLRIVRKQKAKEFKTEIIDYSKANLCQVRCVQVVGLSTILIMDNEPVPNSEKTKLCHIDDTSHIFYFEIIDKTGSLKDIVLEENGLLHLVQTCINQDVSEYLLMKVLLNIKEPHRIRHFLDKLHIDPYNLCLEPTFMDLADPGTYVEDKMLPFLVHDLRPFQTHEYRHVAMEIRQEDADRNIESTYKYVHIKQRVMSDTAESDVSPVSLIYSVDCGDGNVHNVDIGCLYRFIRSSEENTDDFRNDPKNETEFKEGCHHVREQLRDAWQLETFKRNRIIERLMRHWCDGSNKGNAYAKRVFNYIRQIVIQLERGEEVTDSIDMETGVFAPSTNNSFIHNLSQSVQQESRHRMEEYMASRPVYETYSHKSAEEAIRPDIKEAKRWLKQASKDYQAAYAGFENMSDVQGNNWICYQCLQASEKAMKAVLYSINANKVPRDAASHDLTFLADPLCRDLREQASLLMSHLGNQNKLRYPDVVFRGRIPSDMYDKEAAIYAINHTRRVIELASKAIHIGDT